ncbi:MBL fold metallo-hydrolase [Nitrogeniibacter mangrovi]|uniref:MBL fold metallo-hydrolase n=1 Tax=Nitrogeniibacter mangrovi TaxID=2016596 RepID=A0A6C1B579_9RHOO|nr:MBL fold metallo-hydrolase [Nitrogeniibacter mangrovi]QID17440.1 MBL fold metallo-hydrolase [Nitrogeniibacter mangrovi]
MRAERHAWVLLALLWHAACGAVGLTAPQVLDAGVLLIAPRHGGAAPDGATNVVMLAGRDHTLVFGTGQAYRDGRFLLDVLANRRLPPVRMALIPAGLPGYVFGAAALQDAGVPVAATAATAALVAQRCEQCLERLLAAHGEAIMAGSRVPVADETLHGATRVDLGGRRVRLIDLGWAAVPGELALFDEATATLVTAEAVTGEALPWLHDAQVTGWLAALDRLAALQPRRIVVGRGAPLPPAAIDRTRAYLVALRDGVREAYHNGLSLNEAMAALRRPGLTAEEARVHAANVQYLYLRLEKADLEGTPP